MSECRYCGDPAYGSCACSGGVDLSVERQCKECHDELVHERLHRIHNIQICGAWRDCVPNRDDLEGNGYEANHQPCIMGENGVIF